MNARQRTRHLDRGACHSLLSQDRAPDSVAESTREWDTSVHIGKRRALAERVIKYKVGEIREVEVMEDKWAMRAAIYTE